jgi:hypothetical protein
MHRLRENAFGWLRGCAPRKNGGAEKGKSAIGAFTHNYFANIIYENREWTAKSADLAQSLKLATKRPRKS